MEQRRTRTVKVSEVLPAIRTVTATIGRARAESRRGPVGHGRSPAGRPGTSRP